MCEIIWQKFALALLIVSLPSLTTMSQHSMSFLKVICKNIKKYLLERNVVLVYILKRKVNKETNVTLIKKFGQKKNKTKTTIHSQMRKKHEVVQFF